MIARIDYVLDRITMYRLVLYVLIGLIAMAAVLSFFQLLPFSPLALLLSTVFLVHHLLGRKFDTCIVSLKYQPT